MLFKKKEKGYKELLREKIKKCNTKDLLFIRYEVFIELKKRGVIKCSK